MVNILFLFYHFLIYLNNNVFPIEYLLVIWYFGLFVTQITQRLCFASTDHVCVQRLSSRALLDRKLALVLFTVGALPPPPPHPGLTGMVMVGTYALPVGNHLTGLLSDDCPPRLHMWQTEGCGLPHSHR